GERIGALGSVPSLAGAADATGRAGMVTETAGSGEGCSREHETRAIALTATPTKPTASTRMLRPSTEVHPGDAPQWFAVTCTCTVAAKNVLSFPIRKVHLPLGSVAVRSNDVR